MDHFILYCIENGISLKGKEFTTDSELFDVWLGFLTKYYTKKSKGKNVKKIKQNREHDDELQVTLLKNIVRTKTIER
ncbi:MAG: hypothetical protein ACOC1X_04475 [Promethearchaeota archaeon]